jgi:hypothetical protein
VYDPKREQILSLMKIRPMAAELYQVEKQTDMTKLIVAFRNFGEAPKKRGIFSVFADMGA